MFPFHIHQTFSKKNVAEGFQKCEFGSLLFQWNKNSVVNPDVLRPDHRLKGDKCLEFVTDLSICRRQILLRQIVALLMPFFAIPPPALWETPKKFAHGIPLRRVMYIQVRITHFLASASPIQSSFDHVAGIEAKGQRSKCCSKLIFYSNTLKQCIEMQCP